jgi:hypothetical protein
MVREEEEADPLIERSQASSSRINSEIDEWDFLPSAAQTEESIDLFFNLASVSLFVTDFGCTRRQTAHSSSYFARASWVEERQSRDSLCRVGNCRRDKARRMTLGSLLVVVIEVSAGYYTTIDCSPDTNGHENATQSQTRIKLTSSELNEFTHISHSPLSAAPITSQQHPQPPQFSRKTTKIQ